MRIFPSQSSVMNRNVGSTASLTTVKIEPVALGDARPIMHAGAAQGVDAHANLRIADHIHIQNVAEIAHIVL